VRGAQVPDPGEEAGRRHDHPGLTLDGFDEHGDHALAEFADGRGQRV